MKTQFASLPFLTNLRTRVVYFLALPIANLALLVLINGQYSGQFDWQVAIASIAIDATALSLQAMAQLLVTDARLGIDIEMLAKRPYSVRYWGSKFMTAILSGLILIVINLVLAGLIGAPIPVLIRCLIMAPAICLCGSIVGFGTWVLAWQMKNPFFFSNLMAAVIVLLSGVIIVTTRYPNWLETLSFVLPFSEMITYIKTGNLTLLPSVVITAIWLLIGCIGYVIQRHMIQKVRLHQY